MKAVPIRLRRYSLLVSFLFCVSNGIVLAQDGNTPDSTAGDIPIVTIETEAGDIIVALYRDLAPISVNNFMAYVDSSYFDDGVFFRTVRDNNQPKNPVKIDVIQGRAMQDHVNAFPSISIERTKDTGLAHTDGVISMARSGPDTATSHFFICVGDQPELDFGGERNADGQGFAAFGTVIAGMDVVKKIHQMPANNQTLTPPVRIISIMQIE